jgi:hypothetical protein
MALDDDLPTEGLPEPQTSPTPAGTGATVIRTHCGHLDINTFPPLLAQHAGLAKADATRACMRAGGIVAENLAPAAAEALAQAMRDLGEDCFVVSAAEVVALPPEQHIHSARFGRADWHPLDAAGHEHAAPWQDALTLSAAHLALTTTRTVSTSGLAVHLNSATRMPVGDGSGRYQVKSSSVHTLVDLAFANPLRLYRLDGREFDYSILGEQRGNSSEENIQALVRWLVYAAPRLHANFDTQQLLQTGHLTIPTLSAHDFTDLTRWLVNLARLRP